MIPDRDLHAAPTSVTAHLVRKRPKDGGDRLEAQYVTTITNISERRGKLTDITADIDN
jgi:hypothetical protein